MGERGRWEGRIYYFLGNTLVILFDISLVFV